MVRLCLRELLLCDYVKPTCLVGKNKGKIQGVTEGQKATYEGVGVVPKWQPYQTVYEPVNLRYVRQLESKGGMKITIHLDDCLPLLIARPVYHHIVGVT